jgi:hypothetical protein
VQPSNPSVAVRTLTCNAVSATDADFRAVTIDGAAVSGGNITGTRLGDAGQTTGITFSSPKTVYWNLAGNNNWSATAWATSLGDTPSANNFPLPQDTAVVGASSPGSGATITMNAGYYLGTVDLSARGAGQTMTLSTTSHGVLGSWIGGAGVTYSGTSALTFIARNASRTITSSGRTFTQQLAIECAGGAVTLSDALICSRVGQGALSIGAGTFDAANYNVTLSGGVSVVSTLSMGTGTWTTSGNGTMWSYTSGTVTGAATYRMTSTSAKTFSGGSASYPDLTVDQGGSGTLTLTAGTLKNLTNTRASAGAATINFGTNVVRFYDFTAAGQSGRVLTLQGSSDTSPCSLVYIGSGEVNVNFLTLLGVRAYPI